MLSGHSFEASRYACQVLNMVHPAETWVHEHGEWLRASVARNVGRCPETLRMRFETRVTMSQDRTFVIETQTRLRFGIPLDARGIVRVGVPADVSSGSPGA